ncbi:MAG: retroviral-like aspartic protease family protein [Colwellia sp.]|nr:retroviral-like aspartic protease family protein [Colwellia sp.]
MSRIILVITLAIGLICSVALNFYLVIQLNIGINLGTIESEFKQLSAYLNNDKSKVQSRNLSRNQSQDQSQDQYSDNDNSGYSNSGSEYVTKSAEQLVNSIKKAITDKDYFIAGDLINALANDFKADYQEKYQREYRSEHSPELANVKRFWLKATKTLIGQKHYSHAENSISAYLAFRSDDSDFLYQQVDLYWQQQLPLLAIKRAYEVQYHVYNEAENRSAINFARELVQQQVETLITNEHWLELSDLVEEVQVFDSQYLNLQWLFARAQYQLGEFDYALNAIQPLLDEPNYKIKARLLLADIEAALRSPQSIPLNRQGEHFIVQGLINDSYNVSLMIDTGASISLLSEPAFNALSQYSDVVYIKDLSLNTAGGQVTASIYQVAEFDIQGYIINDFAFAVSPFVSENNDGLLGMNFLRAFDFHIDQKNSVLILKNK